MRVVIYRRLMLRIAEHLAARWQARALVTGEVIGQVASQTLDTMITIAGATTMQLLRPLVGMDKDEIVAEAQRIGTFPISILPDEDCCTLFMPRHPATRARPSDAAEVEQALPIGEMVAAAVASASVEDFKFPVLQLPVGRTHA
jgi:thiamine biosynthesis protein ThiI